VLKRVAVSMNKPIWRRAIPNKMLVRILFASCQTQVAALNVVGTIRPHYTWR
jgi:hypothetical protein